MYYLKKKQLNDRSYANIQMMKKKYANHLEAFSIFFWAQLASKIHNKRKYFVHIFIHVEITCMNISFIHILDNRLVIALNFKKFCMVCVCESTAWRAISSSLNKHLATLNVVV